MSCDRRTGCDHVILLYIVGRAEHDPVVVRVQEVRRVATSGVTEEGAERTVASVSATTQLAVST